MRVSTSVLAITALLAGEAFAGLLAHRNFHVKKSPTKLTHEALYGAHKAAAASSALAAVQPAATSAAPAPVAPVPETKQASTGSSLDMSKLTALTAGSLGQNSKTRTGNAWIGTDGDFTNDFTNGSPNPIYLVIWGPLGSWVNANQPLVTLGLGPGETQTVSFASGASGGWAAIYPDTVMSMGQISQTWGEYTFGPYSTVDVSREVNMNGRPMSIKTPNCISDMNTCVFKCLGGATTCLTGYELSNCAPGSQPGANYGTSFGAPSGGCSNIPTGSKLQTTFS